MQDASFFDTFAVEALTDSSTRMNYHPHSIKAHFQGDDCSFLGPTIEWRDIQGTVCQLVMPLICPDHRYIFTHRQMPEEREKAYNKPWGVI